MAHVTEVSVKPLSRRIGGADETSNGDATSALLGGRRTGMGRVFFSGHYLRRQSFGCRECSRGNKRSDPRTTILQRTIFEWANLRRGTDSEPRPLRSAVVSWGYKLRGWRGTNGCPFFGALCDCVGTGGVVPGSDNEG